MALEDPERSFSFHAVGELRGEAEEGEVRRHSEGGVERGKGRRIR